MQGRTRLHWDIGTGWRYKQDWKNVNKTSMVEAMWPSKDSLASSSGFQTRLNLPLIGMTKAMTFITTVIYWNNMCVCVNVGSCNFRLYIIVYIYCSHLGFIKKWWFSDHRGITDLSMLIFFPIALLENAILFPELHDTYQSPPPKKKPRIIMIWWWNVLHLKKLCRNHTVLIQ